MLICVIAALGKLNSSKAIVGSALLLSCLNLALHGQYQYLLQNHARLYQLVYVVTYSCVSLVYMLLGVCLYNFYRKFWSWREMILAFLATVGLFILAFQNGPAQELIGVYYKTYLSALGVFVGVYALRRFWRQTPTLKFLADVSYPLYVVHGLNGYILMTVLDRLGVNPYVNLGLTIALMLLVSYILHIRVEDPSNKLGKRLIDPKRRDASETVTGAVAYRPQPGRTSPAASKRHQRPLAQTESVIFQDGHFYSGDRNRPRWRQARLIMSVFMLVSDLVCLTGSAALAIAIWRQIRTDFIVQDYLAMILPLAGCFIVVYFLIGLYPGIGIGPVEELRRSTISSSVVMLGVVALGFYLSSTTWSRGILALSWFFIVFSIPISRKVFRRLAVGLELWGLPAVVIGNTTTAFSIFEKLRQRPLTGLWPVLQVADAPSTQTDPLGTRAGFGEGGLYQGVQVAIVAAGEDSFEVARSLLGNTSAGFNRIIVVFDEEQVGPLWFTSLHLAEHLGLEVVHNLLSPAQQAFKRLLDLILIVLSFPFLLIFFALAAVLIKLDSPGPVFYSQKRIGYAGREIRIWKFRSMASDAEQRLKVYLEQHPLLQHEWQQNFKLKNDPRITRVGDFLRRTSLDELPQVWNVLLGEMSLIGPRPIVEEELPLYGEEFQIYSQVLPGLTGMWQISGRNDLPYRERVDLDAYYVQNWSIWLDIHILLHTVLAAIQGRGAY